MDMLKHSVKIFGLEEPTRTKDDRGFHKVAENGINGIRGFTAWKGKIQQQNVTPSGAVNLGP